METIIVDRIENDVAICEVAQGEFKAIPLSLLPKDIKEGSVLKGESTSNTWFIDTREERARKNRIEAKMNALFK